MTVTIEDGKVLSVENNSCKRGEIYAHEESVKPLRMVTAVAQVEGSKIPVSLKTQSPIPKDKIAACMKEIKGLKLRLPILMEMSCWKTPQAQASPSSRPGRWFNMPLKPIVMQPVFRSGDQTPWGGRKLRQLFNKDTPDNNTGESLELSPSLGWKAGTQRG